MFYLNKRICAGVFSVVYIYIVVGDLLSEGESRYLINRANSDTFLCLSHARTWISNAIFRGIFVFHGLKEIWCLVVLYSIVWRRGGFSSCWYWLQCWPSLFKLPWEEFEDTKGVIRIRISKKDRQRNGQKKKYKRTNNDLQNRCSGRVSSSCSTSGTRRFNLVTNPVISHEWGKDREGITTSEAYPWSLVTQI